MMRVPVVLLGCCLFLSGAYAEPSAEAPEVRQLLNSAEYWAGRQRPDLVRQLMRKLLAIQPRHPKALQALGLAAASPEPTRPAPTARASRSPVRRPAPSVVAHAQTARTALPQPQAPSRTIWSLTATGRATSGCAGRTRGLCPFAWSWTATPMPTASGMPASCPTSRCASRPRHA